VAEQPDHPRYLDLAVSRADPIVILLAEVAGAVFADLAPGAEIVGGKMAVFQTHHLGQILAEQAKSPPHGDDVDGHEQLVQDQDTGVESRVGAGTHDVPFLWKARRAGDAPAKVKPSPPVPTRQG